MSGIITIVLASLGLIATAPQQPPPARLVAQQAEPTKGKRGRPPVPDLKKIKEIKSPEGRKGTEGSSRFQPIKPTIRPRGSKRTPGLMRPDKRSDRSPTRPIRPDRPDDSRTRRLRSSERPAGQDDKPAKGEREEVEAKGDVKIEKEKKCKPLPPYVRIQMNFNEAEVLEIVQWISEQTCKNFIIGDGIRGGKITILSNTAVTANEAYRAFLSALNVNNMTVVKVGNFYKIQMKRDAVKDTIPTYIGDEVEIPTLDQMVTRVVNLKFVDANTVNGTIKQLTTKDGDSYPYAPTNTLIVSDTGNNMYRLMEILKQLDTPLGQEEIRVVQINYAVATELAQTLEEIFGEKGGRGGSQAGSHRIKPVRPRKGSQPAAPPVRGADETSEESISLSKAIADDRTNKIILVATSRSFPKIQDLIDKLDVPIPGEGQIQVVYLEHADAEELASTLTSLAQGTASRPKTSSTRKSSASPPGGPTKAAELFQGEVKVTADKATNSLVIVASLNDFKSLIKVIKKLDIPRRQVFVEAVIMEVNVDTSKDVGLAFHGGAAAEIGGETVPLFFGTQFKAQGNNFNSLVPNISMLGFMSGIRGPDLPAEESILGSIALPSFGVMLQALQTDSNVNVLSTPHILTSDNEEAEIKVGENIPIPAGYGGYGGGMSSLMGLASQYMGTQQSTTAGYPRTGGNYPGLSGLMGMGMGAINRQEVGLTLKIKPQINEGNVIRMELEEELSEVKDTSNPLGPTTTKRSAKTVVEVQDQQTVVVGGLIRDKIDIGETKIPVLGDIPVLGWFFRTRREQKTKTNLLLFLTPYVIEGPEDFRAIFNRKIEERKEFLERFYGHGPEYKAFVDFRKKHGPLSDMHIHLREELRKVENGGPGSGTEIIVTPEGQIEASAAGGPKAARSKEEAPETPAKPDQSAKQNKPSEGSGENRLEVE